MTENLTGRPFIAVLDLETTGFSPTDAVIEFGRADLFFKHRDLLGEPILNEGSVSVPVSALINPGRPVPPESSAVHHLIDADLADKPSWEEAVGHFRTADLCLALAAHSASFERQFLTPEVTGEKPWLCTYKCALRAWPEAPGHSNQTLRYWLNPVGLDRGLATPAHRAGPDAYVTAFLLRELLRLHSLETLLAWSAEPAVLIRVPFGKRPEEGGWRGCRWTEVDHGFLYWVVSRDFGEDVLHTVRLEIDRRKAADHVTEEVTE